MKVRKRTRLISFLQKATLFYWSIHGILIVFDGFFMDAFGYFVGKFAILSALFCNVIYQHDIGKMAVESSTRADRKFLIVNSRSRRHNPVFESFNTLSTAVTATDATQPSMHVSALLIRSLQSIIILLLSTYMATLPSMQIQYKYSYSCTLDAVC